MGMKSVKDYLAQHDMIEIRVGNSGADVYEIDGKYVLKHVLREKLTEEGMFDAYLREAYFYQSTEGDYSYHPKVLEISVSENEVVILMKKYKRIDRSVLNEQLLHKIMRALARVHTDRIPAFLRQDRRAADPLSAQSIKECFDGWKSVLAEHQGTFDESRLVELAEKINHIVLWHAGEEHILSHGDFHWDNLLIDEDENIVICDWQGVNEGGASGDLSFFISRLGADGVQVNPERLLDHYAEAVYELAGKHVEQQEIIRHMYAANVITSFLFWHQYLHGSAEERVRGIFEQMIGDEQQIARYLDE